jgi:hypothetical protein
MNGFDEGRVTSSELLALPCSFSVSMQPHAVIVYLVIEMGSD